MKNMQITCKNRLRNYINVLLFSYFCEVSVVDLKSTPFSLFLEIYVLKMLYLCVNNLSQIVQEGKSTKKNGKLIQIPLCLC